MPYLSLTTKLSLVIVLGFLTILALATSAFNRISDDFVYNLGQSFVRKQVLYDRERSLRPILRNLAIAKKLARSPQMIQWSQQESNRALKKNAFLELESIRNEFEDHNFFFAIQKSGSYYFKSATDGKGNPRRFQLDPAHADDQWFYQSLLQPEDCLLNIGNDRNLKVNKFWINCIIRTPSKAVGIVGTGIDLTSFIAKVINDHEAGSENLFINAKGAIQASRDQSLIEFQSIAKGKHKTIFSLIEKEEERKQFQQILVDLKAGRQDISTTIMNIKGAKMLVGAAYIKEFNWYNISLLEIRSWRQLADFTPMIQLLVAALLLFALVLWLSLRFLVVQRVSKINSHVNKLAEGNFQIQWNDSAKDELGILSESIGQMCKMISNNTENLESQVQKRTEELKQANLTKDKFFKLIAHDLIGPVGGLASLFSSDVNDFSQLDKETYQVARDSLQQIHKLLVELLQWANLQKDSITTNRQNFYLRDTITNNVLLQKNLANQKGISLSVDCSPDLLASGDENMIGTVIRNLIHNAIKFTPTGGVIRIDAAQKEGVITCSITDNGEGVSTEIRETLFQLEKKPTSHVGTNKERGSGFGLLLCKEFMDHNQGSIGLDLERKEGSRFWFTLPAAK